MRRALLFICVALLAMGLKSDNHSSLSSLTPQISVKEARQIAENFLKIEVPELWEWLERELPQAELQRPGVTEEVWTPNLEKDLACQLVYQFDFGGSSLKIEAKKGVVVWFYNREEGRETRSYFSKGQKPLLTKEQTYQIAWEFVRKYAPYLISPSLKLTRFDEWDGEHMFWWDEVINGVHTLRYMYVSVSAYTGKIIDFSAVDHPVTVSLVPKVSKEEAIQIALRHLEEKEVIVTKVIDAELHVSWGDDSCERQILLWRVRWEGYFGLGLHRWKSLGLTPKPREGLPVGIDAHTGVIVQEAEV